MRTILPLGVLAAVAVFISACAGSDAMTVTSTTSSPVVAEIGESVLTLSEFEDRYARSAGARANPGEDSAEEYEDFLRRYVDFRLKVLAGKDAGLHLIPEVASEIETYRNNFARPYMLEQEVIEPLVREVYDRQQSIIRARHILIRVDENAAPSDTARAYERLAAIVDSIDAGADFGDMARRHSEDPSAQRPSGQPGSGGDLGFFSTGQMVEPFETYAYTTDVGALSPIFRTSFGYHVLRVDDRRQNPDPIRVSHLMIDPSAHADASVSAREFAEQLRDRARAGEDFAELVAEYSHDMTSATRGGDLGFIEYTSRIVPSFIEGAFSVESVGQVSDVVETPFGFHLIKLTDRGSRPSFEEAYPELKQRVARMPRAQEAERALAAEIRAELGDEVHVDVALAAAGDRDANEGIAYLASNELDQSITDDVVARLGGTDLTIADLNRHLQANPRYRTGSLTERLSRAIDDMLSDRAIERRARGLEQTDAEFAALMREFEEGLILFRFMEDSVWTAAATDSAAIEAIYRQDPDRYRYPERSRVITVSTSSDSLMAVFTTAFDEAASVAEALERVATVEGLRVDTTHIAERTESAFDLALDLPVGARTEPTRERGRRVVMIHDGIEAPRTKTLDEARPEIVSAYQEQLEQEILTRLRQRYEVRLYPERLSLAFDGERAGIAAQSSN
jgi:peptidyl-prolyl cis-trans isomerase SurA